MAKSETNSQVHANEVSNENLTITVTQKPHCQVKFEIKVKSKATEAAYQKALKNVSKEVSIPGFRKGKAPLPLILEKYQSTIQREFVDLVLHLGFNEACHLTHLHPLKDGTIKRPVIQECSREKGAHFTIEFEARPSIPSIPLEELEVKKVSPQAVTDQDRTNVLNNLVLQFATYDLIEDRPAQENDFVDVTLTLLEDPPREVIHNQRVQANPSQLSKWICQKIIGLRAGESAEGMTEQDATFAPPQSDFQPRPFRLTVNAIWTGHLPPLDEELAKRVGLQSIEEVKKKIDERLEADFQEEAFKQQAKAIERALIKKYPIDIPLSYLEAQKEANLQNYLKQLEEKGVSYTKEDLEKIEEEIKESTLHQLQLLFLVRKLISDHHIEVSQQDISQELARQMSLMSSGKSSVNFAQEKQQFYEELERLALERKVEQFLIDHAALVE